MMNRRNQPKEKSTKRMSAKLCVESRASSPKSKTPILAAGACKAPRGYVKVIGTGHSLSGARFVRLKVNGKKILISVNDLLGSMIPVYARLQNHGAALADPAMQKDLWGRILAALQKEDTFPVATRLGWFRSHDGNGKGGDGSSSSRRL